MFGSIIRSMRPKQWTKNLSVFVALLFSFNLTKIDKVIYSLNGFILFCILSGAVYIFNDVIDMKNDQIHPEKKNRPIASGELKLQTALVISIILTAGSIIAGFYLNMNFGYCMSIYLLIQIVYSLFLKNFVILDVFCIASGFVIRVAAGAEVISLPISSWLLICTTFISLFLALCKRRYEFIILQDSAINHRKVLDEYNLGMIDQMITIASACTIIAYSLYTMSDYVIEKFGNDNLQYTIPFVIYGLFRYFYLVHKKGKGGRPEDILLTDIPLIINIILYLTVSILIIY